MTDWPHGSGEMSRRIRAHDWASTPLGPMAAWPQCLRTAVDLVLASGHAMQLAWGPDRILFYNDSYAPMLGVRHPEALGIPFRQAWPDVWRDIEPLVDRVFAGETVNFEDLPLVMTRHGYAEDTWWSFSYSPVRDEAGAVAGLLNVPVDVTAKHLAAQAERERDRATALLQENETRFRALVTAGGSAIYRLSPDWRLRYPMDGQSPARTAPPVEDWIEQSIPPEDLPAVREAMNAAIGAKSLFELEHRVRLDGGGVAWVLSRAVPLLCADGSIREWFGADRDVTARKTAEQRLRASEERHAFLLKFSDALRPIDDAARVKVVATDLLGEKLAANRVFYADAEGGHWLVTPGFEQGITPLPTRPFRMSEYGDWIIAAFRAGKALVVDDMATDARFSDEERRAHLVLQIGAEVAIPLVKDRRLVSMLVVQVIGPRAWSDEDLTLLADAAERTWAAVERARAEAALHAADRRKDEFLAVLGHELRNGLAPLVYNAEIVHRSAGNPDLLQELSTRTARQLQHVVRLVDDLLDVARINTGKIELSLEQLRVRDIVNLALDACRADIDRKRHRLAVIEEAEAGLAVLGDRVRLTQVVSNVLSNATKYMDRGGSITVRIARQDENALIEVSDTGIGIPPASLPHVFDLFTQVRNQQAYSAGGLGIGLSLVKQLVEMHGGMVTAVSEGAGRGTTLAVCLPMAAGADAAEADAAAQGAAAGQGRALSVLVVDDLRDAADSLAELLRLQGHDTTVAYGGAQAIELVRHRRPDLVLLDLGMPGMDGFEVCRRLRSDFALEPPMRIVAVTGWGQDSDRQKTRAASFDDHLTKPPSNADLQAVLTAARRLLA